MTTVAIAYNTPVSDDPSERGVLRQVEAIESSLQECGYVVTVLALDEPARFVGDIALARPDVIVNCCEAFAGRAHLEMSVAGFFELLGVAYTGSPPLTLGMAQHKALAKSVLRAHGIPTPRHAVLESDADVDAADGLVWPRIVKPVAQDASIGIDVGAVVHDRAGLADRVHHLMNVVDGAALVEEYIDGREFMVALLARSGRLTALPIEELDFGGVPVSHPRIVTFDSKWSAGSPAYLGTRATWPSLDRRLVERLNAVALSAAHAVGLRDYGRVDCRMNERGELFVLEVNPNPDIGPDSGFALTCNVAGLSYADLARTIVESALARRPAPVRPPPPPGGAA